MNTDDARVVSDINSMTTTTFPISLTPAAVDKAAALIRSSGRDDLRLRLDVQPGGCSGLIYQLQFSDLTHDGDLIEDYDGLEVAVNEMCVPYLAGAVVDFEDSLDKQGFNIDNPNAAGTCACGDSFH